MKKFGAKEAKHFINGKKTLVVNEKRISVYKLLQACPYNPFDFSAEPEQEKKYYFDTATAQFYLDFFWHCLKFIEGNRFAGKPFKLELWQACIVANMYGWKRQDGPVRNPREDFRRYVEVFIYVPRKNGKTPLAAGLAIIALTVENEASAQVYSAAANRDQAAIIYNHASVMIESEPELDSRCTCYRSNKSIEFHETNSIFKSLSSDAHTKHGTNISCVIIDELHAHKNSELTEVLTSGTASRDQPQTVFTTTADFNRKSVCNDHYEYACQIRDNPAIDPTHLPIVYEATEDDDWTDPKIWEKCNPNLDVSVRREYLERECKKAQTDLTKQNTFKRLHLNIRTSAVEIWFDMHKWDMCKRHTGDLSDPVKWRKHMLKAMEGRVCYGGLDLSSKLDITSLCLFFPEENMVIPYFFIPENNIREQHQHYQLYLNWKQQGFLELTPGEYISQDAITSKIESIRKLYNLRGIAIDHWNATGMFERLENMGVTTLDFPQGTKSYNDPCKVMEALVLCEEFDHGHNPVLKFMVSNAARVIDHNDMIKPSKKDSTGKIDGLCATLMGMGFALKEEEHRGKYEDAEILVIEGYDDSDDFH